VPTKNDDQIKTIETTLWNAADKLRKNIDAAEYKHVVLGLIFLKYISDAFEELYEKLDFGEGDYEGADPAPNFPKSVKISTRQWMPSSRITRR